MHVHVYVTLNYTDAGIVVTRVELGAGGSGEACLSILIGHPYMYMMLLYGFSVR